MIPGRAAFSADVRAPDDATRTATVRELRAEIEAICARRQVEVGIATIYEANGCACAPWLVDQLEAAVDEEGIAPRRLASGAGHDAMALAALTDIGMLFVRCERGVSHHPDEAVTAEDAAVAARTLVRFIRNFHRP